MMRIFEEGLLSLLGEAQVKRDEPMRKHTTFRIGGPAAYYVTPATAEQIAGVIHLCRQHDVPYYVLGNGSNLLVSDSGFAGVVIAMGTHWNYTRWQAERVTAGAGTILALIARQAYDGGFTGMEFAAGIPGTLGGAVVMNAGAYGSEMKHILESVTVLTGDGEVRVIPAAEMCLGYRTSCVRQEQYLVLEAVLKLAPGEPAVIKARMDELAHQRRTKQPLEFPSAGSTFKRPEGYFAGKLIQDSGLKGYQVGGAQVSEKHSGFVINCGGATACDVLRLCRHVQEEVHQQHGVLLEMEIKTLGDF